MRFSCLALALLLTLCACAPKQSASPTPPSSDSSQPTDELVAPPQNPKMDVSMMLPEDAMRAALKACQSLLESMPDTGDASVYMLSQEQIELFMTQIEKAGAPVTSMHHDLRGYEQIVKFADGVKNGENIQTGIFTVSGSGITLLTLAQNKGRQMTCTTTSYFPAKEMIVDELEETKNIKMTDNGFLLYGDPGEKEIDGKGFRVIPLGDDEWEAYRKYVDPIFSSASKLVTENWDAANMGEIDLSYVFESLYPLETGKLLSDSDYPLNSQIFTYTIPAQDVERILMNYLPVTEEQLRVTRGYQAGTKTYHWGCAERGADDWVEVTDVQINADGSKTLICNRANLRAGVSKLGAFALTVSDNSDGTFKYLSNRML